MIKDKLDDPNDALSFSGVMLMPEQVAERAVGLIDKPKPVLAIPALARGSSRASSTATRSSRSGSPPC